MSWYQVSETCQIPDLPRLLESRFGRKADGVFVEIGAFDGDYVSNTSGLADMGWTGFYVEPVPEYFERCKTRHVANDAVTVSRYAVGASPGEVDLYVGGVLTTARDDVKGIFDRLDWSRGLVTDSKVTAPMVTLERFLEDMGVGPGFDLLSVDVEGLEWDVFRVFDIRRWSPGMVIVELHDENDDYLDIRADCASLAEYFWENDYKVVWKDLSNTVYVPWSPRGDAPHLVGQPSG